MKTTKEEEILKEFYERTRNWLKNQHGMCACLGDCDKCGFHKCHGCLCILGSFLRTNLSEVRSEGAREEQTALLAAIEPMFEEAKTVSQFMRRSKWNEALWAVEKLIKGRTPTSERSDDPTN